ncbi:MAG: cupin domain-containing protein, partial [Halodesulfurarchaeum sp.]
MPANQLPTLEPDDEEVLDAEVGVTDDVLVKVFALGPDAELPTHAHPGSTNVFHLVEGSLAVIQDGESTTLSAPAVVINRPGAEHGARNESDERAVLTA